MPDQAWAARSRAAHVRMHAALARIALDRARLVLALEVLNRSHGYAEVGQEEAIGRLRAQLESVPVVEQAKGIVMAKSGCSAPEAFDVLRQASQLRNVKVRHLAEEVVAATHDGSTGQHQRRHGPGMVASLPA